LLNFKLFALETAGWHATSLLLHAATTVLVYFLARRDLKDQAAAVFCATIFAVHPIHVESVTWISGVTEPLMAVPLLGCILCFRRWQDGNDRRWYAASLLLCALALLAKDTAIIIVPILFFYEWLRPREAVPSQRLCAVALAVAPFAALTVVYVVVRAWVLRGFVPGMVEEHATKMQVLLTLPSALWFYFCKLVWPSSLSVYYPFGFVIKPGFANFVLPTLALIAIFVGLWMWSRRQPEAVPACVWLLLPLVPPLIGLGRAVPIMVHDRYLYLPSIGFACCLRWRCGAFDLVSTPWLASR
jgi:4-amino-4-deoxy-L-arabinose transferase-like glycosyltransferase